MASAASISEYHGKIFNANFSDDEMLLLDKIRQEFSVKAAKLPRKNNGLSVCARAEAERILNLPEEDFASLSNKNIRKTLRNSGISDYQVHGSISLGASFKEVITNLTSWSRNIDHKLYNRIGAGIVNDGKRFVAVVFLAKRSVIMEPLPFFIDQPESLTISGRTLQGIKNISLHVTNPAGQVSQQKLDRISYGSFSQLVKLQETGEYSLEILTDEGSGPQVSNLMRICVGNCVAFRPLPELAISEDAPLKDLKEATLKWINDFRKAHKLKAVHLEKRLDKLEQEAVLELDKTTSLTHINEQGIGPKHRLDKAKIKFASFGENLGRNKSLQKLLKQMTESPAHREALLSPAYSHVGLGLDFQNKLFTLGMLFIRFPINQQGIRHIIAHLPQEFWNTIKINRTRAGLKPLHHLGRLATAARNMILNNCENGLLDTEYLRKTVQRKYLTKRNGLVKSVVVIEVADLTELASYSGFTQARTTLCGIGLAETLDGNILALILLGEGTPK